ncbi:hypothetical protein [Aeromonas caviae]|uniref:hypothetical protein n=1 Tax=Aeromonas caviae TaxID=648 RepID=UPI002B47F36E|nr:hypothetical protein [Aeromonas caviae]
MNFIVHVSLIIFMRMASIIDGEPPPFLYSDVTAALVNDQFAIFMVKIMVWQKVCHINCIISLPPHTPYSCHKLSSIKTHTQLDFGTSVAGGQEPAPCYTLAQCYMSSAIYGRSGGSEPNTHWNHRKQIRHSNGGLMGRNHSPGTP